MKLLVNSVMVSDWHIIMFYKSLINKYVIKEVMAPRMRNLTFASNQFEAREKKNHCVKQAAATAEVKSNLKTIDK